MELNELIKQLESLGNAQYKKTYLRHGMGANTFGVSFAHITAIQKKIKIDHELALKLWETGNYEARVIATLVADPALATSKLLDAWCNDLDNHSLSDFLAQYVAKTSFVQKKFEQWNVSTNEWIGRTGWILLALLAKQENDLPDSFFLSHLTTIEQEIHTRKNYVRAGMNSALIGIGTRNDALEKAAKATAKRIGKVEVDHGDTDCKTPDAIEYIDKIKKRNAKKSGKPGKKVVKK